MSYTILAAQNVFVDDSSGNPVQPDSSGQYTVAPGFTIRNNSTISVSMDGEEGQRLDIRPNSHLKRTQDLVFQVLRGVTWYDSTASVSIEDEDTYLIKTIARKITLATRAGRAGSVGTRYGVRLNPNESTSVYCLSGTVWWDRDGSRQYAVSVGQQITIGLDGSARQDMRPSGVW